MFNPAKVPGEGKWACVLLCGLLAWGATAPAELASQELSELRSGDRVRVAGPVRVSILVIHTSQEAGAAVSVAEDVAEYLAHWGSER